MTLQVISTLPTAPARTDDSDTFNTRADALIAALATLVSDVNTWSGQVPALLNPANHNTTSTTSLAIGTGSKSFTVETGKLFYVGQWLIAVSTASPTNYMAGQVTAYNSGTGALTVTMVYTSGSGTIAVWTIGAVPPQNANVNPRAITDAATTGTITPDSTNADLYRVIGMTGTVTFAAPSGSPVAGQKLMLRFKDNGTSRSLVWNATYRPFGSVALPAATTVNKTHYVGMIYNSTDSAWDVISHVVQQ
jgi:hypothetical protein